MSALQALGIAGFRSYSPESLQKLEFQTPLTLIWGKNGSGKTTIIEVLKFITTGALPPSCDKGKNFVMDPKMMGNSELVGDTRLKFKAYNGRPVLAKRRALLSVTDKGSKFQSIEQTLKTKDDKGEMFQINHHCAEIEKQIPQLLGISKSVLENIVFCHQDESLWPFSDSVNLKAIFDEMFQTKKYTKIIECFWQQHKDYVREVKQAKKTLEYMKRLYDDDILKKRIALRDMERLSIEAEKVAEMRAMMKKMEGEFDMNSNAQNEKKFVLMKKRGTLEERSNTINRTLQEEKGKAEAANQEFLLYFRSPISIDLSLEDINSRLTLRFRKKEQLQQELEESKNANIYSQKQMEIMAELKRAKEYMPELKKETSQEDLLTKLTGKVEFMEKKRTELNELKRQKEKIVIPNLLDLPFTEYSYQQQKSNLAEETQRLQALKRRVLGLFFGLFKKVESMRSRDFDSNLEEQLKQVQMKIKMKREEYTKYKQMPTAESIKEKRFKIQYTSIDLQKFVYEYCEQHKKCFFCSRKTTEEDMKVMRANRDKSIKAAERKLRTLEAETADNQHVSIDPEEMAHMIGIEIEKAEELERRLSSKYEEYKIFKEHIEQAKLNEKLVSGLKKVGLDKEIHQTEVKEVGTYQSFVECINQYENLRIRIEPKGRDLQLYQERVRRNKEIAQKRQFFIQQQQAVRISIVECEEFIKNYEILLDIQKRLSGLFKSRGKNHKSKSSESDVSNPEDIERQVASLATQIKGLTLKKQYLQANDRCRILQTEYDSLLKEIKAIDRDLREIDGGMEELNKKRTVYNQLKMDCLTKQREIELKSDIVYEEFERPCQKEYLFKKIDVQNKESAARDIESFCKALESSVSRFHREKMDEVNKYLAEIWKEVYHGEDISHIEIQTDFQENSKKKKNYSYSIMMQKSNSRGKMEMKGRCSMGQKVLASIVIRLAIAEVFSNSARILALDEPTTNLDREHIVNLAHQLGRLIQLNECKYLQMIIISHDLEFIKLLEKYTTSYYEVSRDERRFSIITKKNIRQIFSER